MMHIFVNLFSLLFFAKVDVNCSVAIKKDILRRAFDSRAHLRLFHPAFPLCIKDVIALEDACNIIDIKDRLGFSEDFDQVPQFELSPKIGLPWKILPEVHFPSR